MDMSSEGSLLRPQAVQFLRRVEPSSDTGANWGHRLQEAWPVFWSLRP